MIFLSGCSQQDTSKIYDLEEMNRLHNEYMDLLEEGDELFLEMDQIQDKYSEKGLLDLGKFTDQDKKTFLGLIHQNREIINEEIVWTQTNLDYFKFKEYSDLYISERLNSLRIEYEDLSEMLVGEN